MNRTRPIDGELLKIRDDILQFALDYGLDFYPVQFEVCDYETINILASQGGFPSRYPHWRFGMDYDQMSKGYAYGLQKIYEMVINTDPCYAYLLNANHLVDQKNVMAHVYGHADFFKHNAWFSNTNRKMMDVMANHQTKVRRYMARLGQDVVEEFIDRVLSLDNLLDVSVLFDEGGVRSRPNIEKDEVDQEDGRSKALQSFMRAREKTVAAKNIDSERSEQHSNKMVFDLLGAGPMKDVMLFLLEYAPIQEWQSDIIGILREEAYYFLPQRATKIMNEGWASYWHSTIMTQKALKASELIDFADHHAGVMAMSRQNINPYKVGIELYRDIEHRWNSGKFGKEYQECDDLVEKANWNKDTGMGRSKIFEVRKIHNDLTFIDTFFTQEFCERQQLFTYNYNPRTGRNEITSRDFQAIKSKLLTGLTNFGTPVIEIVDANFENRGELLLKHKHLGFDLDFNYAAETLKNIHAIWKRPVNIETISEGKSFIISFNGKEIRTGPQ